MVPKKQIKLWSVNFSLLGSGLPCPTQGPLVHALEHYNPQQTQKPSLSRARRIISTRSSTTGCVKI